MKVILSTRNPSKLQQILPFFRGSSIEVFSLAEVGIAGQAAEHGTTLAENSLEKAEFARERAPKRLKDVWAMADDTGLFIRALDGRPGANAAVWAGKGAATEQITQHCLDVMKGIADRSAVFRTLVTVIAPDGTKKVFAGEIAGTLCEEARVPAQPMMPYSPLFVPDGQKLCWAEMTVEQENAISHRGIAFRLVREFLENVKQTV